MQCLCDEFAISCIGNCLAHTHIAQLLRLGVERQPVDWPNRCITLVGDFECIDLFKALDLLRSGHERIHIAFPVLHCNQQSRGVFDDPNDDFIQFRAALKKEIRVFFITTASPGANSDNVNGPDPTGAELAG